MVLTEARRSDVAENVVERATGGEFAADEQRLATHAAEAREREEGDAVSRGGVAHPAPSGGGAGCETHGLPFGRVVADQNQTVGIGFAEGAQVARGTVVGGDAERAREPGGWCDGGGAGGANRHGLGSAAHRRGTARGKRGSAYLVGRSGLRLNLVLPDGIAEQVGRFFVTGLTVVASVLLGPVVDRWFRLVCSPASLMNLFRLFASTRPIGLSSGVLIALLQRTPMLRAVLTVESPLAAPVGNLLRAVLAPAAALGAVHTLAGATTQLVANAALPAKATVGQPFSVSVAITGVGVSFAQSWDVTNTLPPGVSPVGAALSGGQFVINSSSGTLTLSGTPTVTGTFTFTARGYQFTNRSGPVTTGSTSIVVAAAPNSAPTITRSPVAQTLTVGGTLALSVTYTGTPAPTFQWLRDGLPIAGATGPTLVVAGVGAADAGSYTVTITNSLGTITSSAAQIAVNAAPAAPVFAAAPAAQTAVAGGAVVFAVEVAGVPAPRIQWLKDGRGIDGATSATLILNNISAADAGFYAALADNASGVVTSPAAQLTVTPAAVSPVLVAQPAPIVAGIGSTVVFSAAATGMPAPTYQWQRDGKAITDATAAALVFAATAADAGSYGVTATNASGTVASTAAALTVIAAATPSRLSNLSILTSLASGESMTLGTVLGGVGTGGSKALLARAAGPSLTQLGVAGVLGDPQLSLVAGATNTTVAANNDWLGSAALSNAFVQVGAFPYLSAGSKDAAVLASSLAPGSYTVQVGDNAGGAGTVIAELYDSTPAGAFTAATPRLVNVSVLKQISAGATLTAGFVVGGTTAKTVLVRAIGPGLAQFAVGGTMPDPKLALFNGASVKIGENDNWGGAAQLTAVGNSVGAFAITTLDSKDAMLLVTLAPGSYSAQVSAADAGGAALVEVYEVP